MVTLWSEVTALVEMANLADVEPPETATVAGTVAEAELDDKATMIPPAGADPVRVTVS
jgi:hypothetical protein